MFRKLLLSCNKITLYFRVCITTLRGAIVGINVENEKVNLKVYGCDQGLKLDNMQAKKKCSLSQNMNLVSFSRTVYFHDASINNFCRSYLQR